eukprot:TRINITY_DN25467_c0_g1_i1.p1 TRINITY_DN25467_c0_g1~~TRINITY_DN25467_c0_g1_i1.p1  ORF type:complete len:497 (+),score=65.85 TRINITY_DN25467_c0_g1_i1:31-1521(+)
MGQSAAASVASTEELRAQDTSRPSGRSPSPWPKPGNPAAVIPEPSDSPKVALACHRIAPPTESHPGLPQGGVAAVGSEQCWPLRKRGPAQTSSGKQLPRYPSSQPLLPQQLAQDMILTSQQQEQPAKVITPETPAPERCEEPGAQQLTSDGLDRPNQREPDGLLASALATRPQGGQTRGRSLERTSSRPSPGASCSPADERRPTHATSAAEHPPVRRPWVSAPLRGLQNRHGGPIQGLPGFAAESTQEASTLGEDDPWPVGPIINLDTHTGDIDGIEGIMGIAADLALELESVAKSAAARAKSADDSSRSWVSDSSHDESHEERFRRGEVFKTAPGRRGSRRRSGYPKPYSLPFDPMDVPDPLGPAGSRLSPTELGFFPTNQTVQPLLTSLRYANDLSQREKQRKNPEREAKDTERTEMERSPSPCPRLLEGPPLWANQDAKDVQDAVTGSEAYHATSSVGRPVEILRPEASSTDSCRPEDVFALCRESEVTRTHV